METRQELEYNLSRDKGFVVIQLAGALGESAHAVLQQAISAVAPSPGTPVVLDMEHVAYIDADGFGALINVQKHLTEKGSGIALIRCQQAVRDALVLTRLEVLFPSYQSINRVPVR